MNVEIDGPTSYRFHTTLVAFYNMCYDSINYRDEDTAS